MFTAPRYHTNQHFVVKALLDAGHEVSFLALVRGAERVLRGDPAYRARRGGGCAPVAQGLAPDEGAEAGRGGGEEPDDGVRAAVDCGVEADGVHRGPIHADTEAHAVQVVAEAQGVGHSMDIEGRRG